MRVSDGAFYSAKPILRRRRPMLTKRARWGDDAARRGSSFTQISAGHSLAAATLRPDWGSLDPAPADSLDANPPQILRTPQSMRLSAGSAKAATVPCSACAISDGDIPRASPHCVTRNVGSTHPLAECSLSRGGALSLCRLGHAGGGMARSTAARAPEASNTSTLRGAPLTSKSVILHGGHQ